MTVDEAIAYVNRIAAGRTRYEGQEPRIDELLVEEIERLRREQQFAVDWMNEIRQACHDATGDNATFIDNDVTQTIRHLMAENDHLRRYNAELEAKLSLDIAAMNDSAATNIALRSRNAELEEALQAVVSDVLEYEEINCLAANPGWKDCWASITKARALLSKEES